jgi:hypothetical protein
MVVGSEVGAGPEVVDTEDELVLGSISGSSLGTRQAVVARTTVLTRIG